jgi:hypothetical protein
MIYLYGLLAKTPAASCETILGISGVTGPVELAVTDLGYLVFGQAETGTLAPKRRNLMAHARVLEACQEHGDLLPMRFGMTARDTDEITQTLALNASEIEAQFTRIHGKVEYGIKINYPHEAALHATISANPALEAEHGKLRAMHRPPHFATAEFGRRLAEALDRRRTDAQRKVLSMLTDLCRDHVLSTPEDDAQILNFHVLAPREMGDVLAQEAQTAASATRFVPDHDAQVRLIGPEPPFHFVQMALETASEEPA